MIENNFRGNPHHLTQLLEAVKNDDIGLWNSYVRKNGVLFRARLAGANLSGLTLSEIKLDNADLSDANLSGIILKRANLSHARLRGCCLSDADLSGARLDHADCTNADLTRAQLSNIHAKGTLFTGANLSEAIMSHVDLTNATMDGATVTGITGLGMSMRARVKVKSISEKTQELSMECTPWIKALQEETARRKSRKNREGEKADEEKARMDRKLGRRKPIFYRVK